jgi:hypothetical protein
MPNRNNKSRNQMDTNDSFLELNVWWVQGGALLFGGMTGKSDLAEIRDVARIRPILSAESGLMDGHCREHGPREVGMLGFYRCSALSGYSV